MNDHIEMLRGLVAKWPQDRHPDPHTDAWTLGYLRAKKECADELDAALAALSAQQVAADPDGLARATEKLRNTLAHKDGHHSIGLTKRECAAVLAALSAQAEAQAQAVIDLRGGGKLFGARVEGSVLIVANEPRSIDGCVFISKGKSEDWGISITQAEAQAECTNRGRCDCIGACKHGRGGNGAEAQAGGEVAFNYAMVHRFATENRINYNALAKLVRECVYTAPPPGAVPEVVVSRQIITPTCRANRGGWGAFSEAFDRVRKAYLHYVEAPQNARVEWHLTLTRVEAADPGPKEGA